MVISTSKAVELVVAWVTVIVYILVGGVTLRNIELDEEVKQATDYCVKVTAYTSLIMIHDCLAWSMFSWSMLLCYSVSLFVLFNLSVGSI